MGTMTLREARKQSGLTGNQVAAIAGCDRATLYRIEDGDSQPRRETARALFALYKGAVDLATIYDPKFNSQASAA